jgi:hypothetical protein
MLALPELQRAFAAAILADQPAPLAGIVQAGGIAPERRIQVYRNNSLITLGEALKATFPVICRLVDERFFDYAARAFILAHPPRQPRLADYGDGFADFLAGFEPAQTLPYLPDVARLEWAINAAYHADHREPLRPEVIAAIPVDDYPGLTFTLDPACAVLRSPYPVDELWRANQPERDGSGVDLGGGECRLLVHRVDDDVRLQRLGAGEHAMTAALAAGHTLGDAFAAALAEEAGFDATALLAAHLCRGLFVGLGLPPAAGESP